MGIDSIKLKRAVFLDRDGVINKPLEGYDAPRAPSSLDTLEIYDGAREALLCLRDKGYRLIVVTNQPDVRRGSMVQRDVDSINNYLRAHLPLDSIEVCFHDDEDGCDCRKPAPGLILRAAGRDGINLAKSYMVGDRWRDIEAGIRAQCTTIWIDHGYQEGLKGIKPHFIVSSLPEAVDLILKGGNV